MQSRIDSGWRDCDLLSVLRPCWCPATTRLLHKHACAISLWATSQSLKRTSVSVRSSLTAFELSFVPSGRLLLPVVVSALPVIPRLRSSGTYWYPASRASRVQTYGRSEERRGGKE